MPLPVPPPPPPHPTPTRPHPQADPLPRTRGAGDGAGCLGRRMCGLERRGPQTNPPVLPPVLFFTRFPPPAHIQIPAPPPPHPPPILPARPRCPTVHDAFVPALTRALMRSRRAFFHAVGPQAAPPADRLCPRLIAPGARFYPGIGLSRHAGSWQIGRIFIKYFRSQAADKP